MEEGASYSSNKRCALELNSSLTPLLLILSASKIVVVVIVRANAFPPARHAASNNSMRVPAGWICRLKELLQLQLQPHTAETPNPNGPELSATWKVGVAQFPYNPA